MWRLVARHQLGAAAATAVDFAAMIAGVHLGLAPVTATAIGAASGAGTNFTLGRRWIFPSGASERAARQALRYTVVSGGSLALNTLGEYLVQGRGHVHYVLARVLVSLAVGLAWNFPLHRFWVFGAPGHE